MGRKTVYTKELLEKIEELASIGYTQKRIEEALGLPKDSIAKSKYYHTKTGRLDILEVFTRASEEFIRSHLKNIENHSEDDWRASKYLLTIRKPEDYSEKQRLELTAEEGITIKVLPPKGKK